MPKVICQKWEERERGWGCRPDGFTLHQTEAHRAAYVQAYWDSMPDTPPDEYSTPDGTPYVIEVSEEVFAQVASSKNGIRGTGDTPPGGIDGWLPGS